MAGTSLEEFFSRFVRGRDELDYNASLGAAGLRLNTGVTIANGKPVEKVCLGADTVQDGDRLIVRRVYAEFTGLRAGAEYWRSNRRFE